MKLNSTISVGIFKSLGWIRCVAKGNFNNSPAIEKWANAQIKGGIKSLAIDLEQCTGMDSTFMGNLAGLAMKLTAIGGKLQIIDASTKCARSLTDLGLSSLMEINPECKAADWDEQKQDMRGNLEEISSASTLDKTTHVYETHKKLCEADSSNHQKFDSVLECLEADLSAKKQN